MQTIEKTVFLSYRREDSTWALAIYQYLNNRGYDVFIDFKSIPSGEFKPVIIENVKARAHFLVLLTPSALKDCSNSEDWLRREIETALTSERNIVPVLLDGFKFTEDTKLPRKLARLKDKQVLHVPKDPAYFSTAMEMLVDKYLNVQVDKVQYPASPYAQQKAKEEQLAANAALHNKPLAVGAPKAEQVAAERRVTEQAAPERMTVEAAQPHRQQKAEAEEQELVERNARVATGASKKGTVKSSHDRLPDVIVSFYALSVIALTMWIYRTGHDTISGIVFAILFAPVALWFWFFRGLMR